MAAALLVHHAQAPLQVSWAHGRSPQVHPFTLLALNERGLDSTVLSAYAYRTPAEVVDVLVDLREVRERNLTAAIDARCRLHWPTLALCDRSGVRSPQMFRHVRDQLERRVVHFLN